MSSQNIETITSPNLSVANTAFVKKAAELVLSGLLFFASSCSDGVFSGGKGFGGKADSNNESSDQIPNTDDTDTEIVDGPEITEPIWINGVLLTCDWKAAESDSEVRVGCGLQGNAESEAKLEQVQLTWQVENSEGESINYRAEPVASEDPKQVEFIIQDNQITNSDAVVIFSIKGEEDISSTLAFKDGLVGFEDGSLEACFASDKTAQECMVDAGILSDTGEILPVSCPEGYILVSENPEVGTVREFCVAKFEMSKDSQTGMAVSLAGYLPWVDINQQDSKLACRDLGPGYTLISNSQWMTLARQVENNPANWLDSSINVSRLSVGNTLANAGVLASDSDDVPCIGTGTCDQTVWAENRRTYKLGGDQIIWDLSGNVSEWVDWNAGMERAFAGGSILNPNGFFEYASVNEVDSMPNATFMPSQSSLSQEANNIGLYSSGVMGFEGAALRGGSSSDLEEAGLYYLSFNFSILKSDPDVGFRCTFSP